jgi:hypothetical protein
LLEFRIEELNDMTIEHESVLNEAEKLVHGDRNASYGHPLDDFRRTAKMWIAIAERQPKPGQPIIAGWIAAPWYREARPDVGLVPYCLYDQGEEGLIWCEWQGGEFPIGEECDWDAHDYPTHWMAWPEPPNG